MFLTIKMVSCYEMIKIIAAILSNFQFYNVRISNTVT